MRLIVDHEEKVEALALCENTFSYAELPNQVFIERHQRYFIIEFDEWKRSNGYFIRFLQELNEHGEDDEFYLYSLEEFVGQLCNEKEVYKKYPFIKIDNKSNFEKEHENVFSLTFKNSSYYGEYCFIPVFFCKNRKWGVYLNKLDEYGVIGLSISIDSLSQTSKDFIIKKLYEPEMWAGILKNHPGEQYDSSYINSFLINYTSQ